MGKGQKVRKVMRTYVVDGTGNELVETTGEAGGSSS